MTLLYLYFNNSPHASYKGIVPNQDGYRFDNRFNITFDPTNKHFEITDNPDYVQIYNDSISNISCIVGKNGSGKTTFIELLITNIAWGITPGQPATMISIYYQKNTIGGYDFFIQNYKRSVLDYRYTYNGSENRQFIFNDALPFSPHPALAIPDSTKYIFHSLSPFDKIFYSIGVPFKEHTNRIPHFRSRMKYLGVQRIFVDDSLHEILTITNLIKLFANEQFSQNFHQSLHYSFSGIEINYNEITPLLQRKFNTNDFGILNDFIETIDKTINGYPRKEEDLNLIHYFALSTEQKIAFFKALLDFDWSFNSQALLHFIIIDMIDFNKLAFISYLKKFLLLLKIQTISGNIASIQKSALNNLQNIDSSDITNNNLFRDYKFLQEVLSSQEEIAGFLELNALPLEKIKEIDNLDLRIKWVKKIKNRGYLNFELNIIKNENLVNYFYLSSGEKTMISYFANLVNAIMEFNNIDNKTFIILIDEVELHLHPEWQRNFIEYMNRFFSKTSLENVKFQFIIATHSPFVLSDITQEQIIVVNGQNSDNEYNTFGANIYDIFEKGFFLDNSIGLCSEEFIKHISQELHYFKALQFAKEHQDFYLLREYLQKPYINYNNKAEENSKLLSEQIQNIIQGTMQLKYINIDNNIIKFIHTESGIKIEKAIRIIGEPTIRDHLIGTFEDLREVVIDVSL